MRELKSITGRVIKDNAALKEFSEEVELEPGGKFGHVLEVSYFKRRNGKGGHAYVNLIARTEVRTLQGSRVQKYGVISARSTRILSKNYPGAITLQEWNGVEITDEDSYNEFKQDINEFKKQFKNER